MRDHEKRGRQPHRDIGDKGGNAPRGDVTGLAGPGESGGPAGVQRSGGREATPPHPETAVPEGMTPGDLQKSPEELVDEWTEE
jgi:hypothetical protein